MAELPLLRLISLILDEITVRSCGEQEICILLCVSCSLCASIKMRPERLQHVLARINRLPGYNAALGLTEDTHRSKPPLLSASKISHAL